MRAEINVRHGSFGGSEPGHNETESALTSILPARLAGPCPEDLQFDGVSRVHDITELFGGQGGVMGKGDRRSRRGKIWRGSFGNTRPKKRKKAEAETPTKRAAPKARTTRKPAAKTAKK